MKTSDILLVNFPRTFNRAVCFGALGLIAAGLAGATPLQAQIVTYDILNANAATSATVTPTAASGVAGGLLSTTGTGTATSLTGSYLWKLWSSAGTPGGSYMQWSLQPDATHQIDFSGGSVAFSLLRSLHVGGATHGPDLWELDYSTDNFATAGNNLSGTINLSATADGEQVPQSFSLTPLGTVAPLTTVSFRLYGFNDNGVGGGGSSGLGNNNSALPGTGGNLLINGTVSAVPEPSSYAAVFGALAFGFVFLTRRLRKA
jgi:hypothetical protein